MKEVKKLTKSKRVKITTLFSASYIASLIVEAYEVSEQLSTIFSAIPNGEGLRNIMVAVYALFMLWTRWKDQKKTLDDIEEWQVQNSERIGENLIEAIKENEQNKDETNKHIDDRSYIDSLHDND